MKKSVLNKKPVIDVKDSWKNLIQQLSNTNITYFIAAELEKIDNKSTLVLNIIDKSDSNKVSYRIFQSHDDYISQDFTDGVMKWRTSGIYNLLTWRYYKKSVLLDNSSELIKEFLKEDESYLSVRYLNNSSYCSIKDYIDESNPLLNLELVQEKIRAERLSKKHQSIKDKIDAKMSLIKEIPEDFNFWINDTVLKKSRYIYYQYKAKSKHLKGYCTHCNTDVLVEGAKHNLEGVCPNCGTAITFKAKGKSTNICDNANVALIQNCGGDEIVVRYFTIRKEYFRNYREPNLKVHEIDRTFYNSKGNMDSYEWWNFKQTNEMRWCDNTNRNSVYYPILYVNNLDEELNGTRWQYSAIKEYATQEENFVFQVWNYVRFYLNFPGLEYLVKLKLYNLVAGVIYNSYMMKPEINFNGKNILESLMISKEQIPVIKRLDANFYELKVIRRASEEGISLSDEQIRLIAKDLSIENIITLSKHTTIHKMFKYVEKQASNYRNGSQRYIFSDWIDYLQDCKTLGYDLKNDFVLFPLNLYKAHQDTIGLIKEKKNEEYNKAIRQMNSKLQKLYSWKYKDYSIVVPSDYDDLVNEGQTLNHCVARNYAKKFIDGDCVIVFLRNNKDIKKPLYTIELDPNNLKIVQVRGKNNKAADDTTMSIIQRYQSSRIKSLPLNNAA